MIHFYVFLFFSLLYSSSFEQIKSSLQREIDAYSNELARTTTEINNLISQSRYLDSKKMQKKQSEIVSKQREAERLEKTIAQRRASFERAEEKFKRKNSV